MNKHDVEKYQLEKSAMDLFIEIYNENFENKLKIFLKQERPDFLLVDYENNLLGMEIAHAFYNPLEAKILLNRNNNVSSKLENFNTFFSKFNKIIIKKCKIGEKFICDYPYSLLIRNTSPIFTSEDIESSIHNIDIPNNQYKNIWILSHNNSSKWVLIRIGNTRI